MHVLITGATGLIGGAVAARLLSRGERVSALCRFPERPGRLTGTKVEVVKGDVTAEDTLAAALRGVDVVVHCAGLIDSSDVAQMWSTNHVGTRNMVRGSLEARVGRFIHASSSVTVGGPGDGRVYDEDDAFDWGYLENPYHLSKRAAEQEVVRGVRQGLNAVILNPVMVCEPAEAESARKNLRLMGRVAQHGAWLFPVGGISLTCLAPVVDAFIAAIDAGEVGSRYLLSGPNVTYHEVLSAVAERCGTRGPRLPIGRRSASLIELASDAAERLVGRRAGLERGAARAFDRYAYYDCARAVRALAYRPPTFHQTITELLPANA